MTHFEIGAGGLAVLSLALAPPLAGPVLEPSGPNLQTGPVLDVTAPDMKCGPQPEGTTALVAIDGVIQGVLPEGDQRLDLSSDADTPLYGGVDRDDLFWVQVVCMNPRDSTFQRDRGLPVASLWTKEGPAGRMAPALAEIAGAQERYFAREGRYIEELSAIDGFDPPDRVEIELEADADFWVATARTERFLGRCTAGGGNATAPSEPECADDR